MDNFVVISGCSGGGKSTLLAELARRGFAVVEEPGRRIVEDELANGGTAVPWLDLEAFLRRAIHIAHADRQAALGNTGITFFDRGLIDAAAGLEALTGERAVAQHCTADRYHRQVFLTPPWREIYTTDDARRHGLEDAIAEYDRLRTVYSTIGYQPTILAKTDITARADFVLQTLGLTSSRAS